MSRYTPPHNSKPVIDAAQAWVRACLVEDDSMLGEGTLSTAANFDALDRYFVQQPDAGDGSFYGKLQTQLADAPPEARKLMAELLWALFLFPSNIGIETKREGVVRVWDWSGDALDYAHPMLTDMYLDGIGSAGMGVNTNRWREIKYMVGLGQAIKRESPDRRAELFADYDRHVEWMETVPQEGDRQFRHMLRFFLFPDRVERMSSNGDRRRVLEGFKVAPQKATRKWRDSQLDDALRTLRQAQAQRYGTVDLDFYNPPLVDVWRKPNETDVSMSDDEEAGEAEADSFLVKEPAAGYTKHLESARNLILYGPPGTGKTWRLQQMFGAYTDLPADLDRATWEHQLVARHGWRAVIAAALADAGKATKAGDLEGHPLIRAKALQRKRTKAVASTVWGYMQEHTSPASTTVNVTSRRAPYLFDKSENSRWALLPDWQEQDSEAAELLLAWQAGPGSESKPVKRYRLVTFHPSYSYEDFVIGLRPVAGSGTEGESSADFRMVDGVFKQACEEARANPGKRHALFIDEINRANISKVFGELITLIEPDKRARYGATGELVAGMEVQLPGTGSEEGDDERFGVPENLDIIGTMNTADRSIALLDIALRRRFEFREIAPDYGLLDRRVDEVDLGLLLRRINERLEFLADRDRLIGHAYLTRVTSIADLRLVFQRQIIPLLQEYFFDDWSRVELVLSKDNGTSVFIMRETMDAGRLFGHAVGGAMSERTRYVVTDLEGWDASSFAGIYQTESATARSEA